jgi:hypothetical protein
MRSTLALIICLHVLAPIGSLAAQRESFSTIGGANRGRELATDPTTLRGTALRDAICRGERWPARSAGVAGRAIDADRNQPLAGAEVQAAWMEVRPDRAAGRSIATRRVVAAKTGGAGEYRICGVPSETLFTLQLRNEGRASPELTLMIAADEGAIARDFSLSARTAATIAALDSVAGTTGSEPAAELRLAGSAALTGVVRGLSGEPIAGARVGVRHARSTTVTDESGRFALGDLPAGTQMLVARSPGYTTAELPVELRSGTSVDRPVLLVRPRALGGIPTTDLEVFDAMRRTNPYGQFLTQEQIDEKRSATEAADLFDEVLGFTALGRGPSARVISNMALAEHRSCSEAKVIVQGKPGRRINDVKPGQIGGIEAYADEAFVPDRYAGQADCGVIVIWLRKSTSPPSHAATGLRANGYP